MKIRIRFNGLHHGPWYTRDYLQCKTCSVVAITSTGFEVKHPLSKKDGYYVNFDDAEIIAGINKTTRLSKQKFHFRDV